MQFRNATAVGRIALQVRLRDMLPQFRFATLAPHFRSLRCFSHDGSVATIFSTGRVLLFSKTATKACKKLRSFIARLFRLGFALPSTTESDIKISNVFGILKLPLDKIELEELRRCLPPSAHAHYDVGAPRAVLRFQILGDDVYADVFHSGKCTLKARSEERLLAAATHILALLCRHESSSGRPR